MSKTIRAMMQVQSVKHTTWSEHVELTCVYGGTANAEANTFAKATPSGGMNLQIDNPTAKGAMKPGDVVYVDIQVIDPKPSGY